MNAPTTNTEENTVHITAENVHIHLPAGITADLVSLPVRTDNDILCAGALTPPALGEYWPGQGGYFCGTMPARDGAPARHLVFAKDEAEKMKWGPYEEVPGAASHHNGAANTRALLERPGKHPAAEWASKVTADGHSDFMLPSRAELMMAWICAPQLFNTEGWYWSSTQVGRNHAFVQFFANGSSAWGSKGYEFRVRAVRWIQLQPFSA